MAYPDVSQTSALYARRSQVLGLFALLAAPSFTALRAEESLRWNVCILLCHHQTQVHEERNSFIEHVAGSMTEDIVHVAVTWSDM